MACLALRPTLVRANPTQAARLVQGVRPLLARPVRRTLHGAVVRASYNKEVKGPAESFEFRLFLKDKNGTVVSPWHDIPLYAGDGTVNFVCEIPKESAAKMEVATDEPNTPIKQDTKKGKLRFYPYNINWNYGLLPQTWEDPSHTNKDVDAAGDNDPVDVVEIGSKQLEQGGVYKARRGGGAWRGGGGERDGKRAAGIIAINVDDPKAAVVNDVEDVEREFPGEIQKVLEWFRDYKIPDGKPANKALNREFTWGVIEETHAFYNRLRSGARANTEELSLV
eukprot:scaffold7.g3507.t1